MREIPRTPPCGFEQRIIDLDRSVIRSVTVLKQLASLAQTPDIILEVDAWEARLREYSEERAFWLLRLQNVPSE